jgi:hypothetical protein
LNGQTYWFASSMAPSRETSPAAHLLPNYDEYFIGLKDRGAIGELARQSGLPKNSTSRIAHMIIIDGQIVGGWRRIIKKDAVVVEFNLITDLTKTEKQAIADTAKGYGKFLDLPVDLAEVD